MLIRFSILAYINKPWIWTLFGDTFYLWGSSRLIYLMFTCFGLTIAFGRLAIIYFELNHRLYCIDHINDIKTGKVKANLKPQYNIKYCLKVKVYTKILWPSMIACAIPVSTALGVTSVLCYMNPFIEDSLVSLFIFNTLFAIWVTFGTALGFSFFFIFQLLTISYLKLEFRQINDTIDGCLKCGNVMP